MGTRIYKMLKIKFDNIKEYLEQYEIVYNFTIDSFIFFDNGCVINIVPLNKARFGFTRSYFENSRLKSPYKNYKREWKDVYIPRGRYLQRTYYEDLSGISSFLSRPPCHSALVNRYPYTYGEDYLYIVDRSVYMMTKY